jgi:hypothetical protein
LVPDAGWSASSTIPLNTSCVNEEPQLHRLPFDTCHETVRKTRLRDEWGQRAEAMRGACPELIAAVVQRRGQRRPDCVLGSVSGLVSALLVWNCHSRLQSRPHRDARKSILLLYCHFTDIMNTPGSLYLRQARGEGVGHGHADRILARLNARAQVSQERVDARVDSYKLGMEAGERHEGAVQCHGQSLSHIKSCNIFPELTRRCSRQNKTYSRVSGKGQQERRYVLPLGGH